ncbi:AraC family transcriptional regulator [Sphingomonas sp. AR_OL41]|uniref:helix-turn-helix domain-containing protein n=1 Tax=Sphingomonas sp. AR_OL41 TaxID=3042729 RepID=UPI002480F28D|nr:AraC family transcriptional regulator [Sphingomonas sp. AR_OL41]MDH7975891.1 AraC family transcriptional regulator [Sphingomonas sp. AR_OL41]
MVKHRIHVSHEMQTFVGAGSVPASGWPAGVVGLGFHLDAATIDFYLAPTATALAAADMAFVVTAAACRRIFGFLPEQDARWHLPRALRMLVVSIVGCQLQGEACDTLRLAKSIETLCATFAMIGDDALIPADSACDLTEIDARRIVAARRLIDERWHEKLTLDAISRACGINRAKLTRGFRAMFDITVADAIAERRLGGAGELLRSTDLPISSIGYRCGYLNNASFTRAFSRRYGVAPTLYRAHRCAA